MAFNSFFSELPFNGSFDNGLPTFPHGGSYPGFQPQAAAPSPSPAGAAANGGLNLPNSQPVGLSNVSGFASDPYNPQFGGGYGDATFIDFPSYGMSPGSYNPQSFGIAPAQGSSFGFGSLGIGDRISSIGDRISSIGNSPNITGGNIGQAAINAAGMFSPLASLGAGLLQGFNLYDAPKSTGNAAADIAFTPGALQSTSADVFNWINRQFGGDYMPMEAPQLPSWVNDYLTGSLAALQSPGLQDSGIPPVSDLISGFVDQPSDGGQSAPLSPGYTPDPYSLTGNMLDTFMLGAGFGGGRFGGYDPIAVGGGGGGFAGWGGGWGGTGQPDDNGGWGQ